MMMSHIKGWMGSEGDTYFQRLAVLQTAERKKNTKERKAEVRGGSPQEFNTSQKDKKRNKRGREQGKEARRVEKEKISRSSKVYK